MVKYLIKLELEVDYGEKGFVEMPLVVLQEIQRVIRAQPFDFVKTSIVRVESEKLAREELK